MSNEKFMKDRGASKVAGEIFSSRSKDGLKTKKIGSTQIGQQMILTESIRLTPIVWDWIQNKTWTSERAEWISIFKDEKTTASLIASSILFLIGNSHAISDSRDLNALKRKIQQGKLPHKVRHNVVERIDERIFEEKLGFTKTFRFIEILVDESSFLEKLSWVEINGDKVRQNVSYSCSLLETIVDELSLRAAIAFYPLPLEEPPADWSFSGEEISGGYHSYQFPMIRMRNSNPEYGRYSREIFDSLNYIQSVAWRVNDPVLKAIENDLRAPQKIDFVKTEFPQVNDFKNMTDEEKEQLNLYNAELGDFESAVGKWRSVKMAIDIAHMYTNRKIYFPHNYDFRGRVYPLPISLSPQGSDRVKAMIEFAEGEVLTKRGEEWSYAYLASLYGDDKLTFDIRVKRGRELLYANYLDADEPYQFLAHQLEMQKYEIDNSYPVKTRIHLDACNSGSQFTSAITGDARGCRYTNVIPNPDGSREDAYQEVANITLDLLRKEELDEETQFLIKLIEDDGRAVCKQPVMVSNYGGTAGGRTDILYHKLRELGVDRKWINKKIAARLSKVMGEAIEGVLEGGKRFEKYIQQFNLVIARKGKSVSWTTKDGFYVEHVKFKEKSPLQIECQLRNGKKTQIIRPRYSTTPNPGKMKNAISPNYIHSLDAMLLRMVALEMKHRGIKNTSWIHDSFGTSPNHVDTMLDIAKRAFIKIIKNRPLKDLDDQLRAQAIALGISDKELDKITVPQLRGFNSNGGLDCLMSSEWFFS